MTQLTTLTAAQAQPTGGLRRGSLLSSTGLKANVFKASFVAAIAATGLALGSAQALADVDEPRSVTVTGIAEQRVAPDMAWLNFEVVTENMDPALARRQADKTTQKALRILMARGIKNEDIDSTGLNIAPQYRWLRSEERQELTGYRVARSIEVRLLDIDQLGRVMTELSDAGINRVQAPRLDLVDPEATYQAVLADAARNARARAEIIAATLGETLGGVRSVSTQRDTAPAPMYRERMAMAMADAAPSPEAESYQSGHLTYKVTLSASFLLQD